MATRTATRKLIETELSPLDIAKLCASAADDKKAGDIIILDVSKLTSFADYFVICSAPSDRQVQAIVNNVQDVLREQNTRAIGIEGMETSSWVLADFGDVIFHCFTDAAREYYDLEGFWIDAPRVSFE